MRTDSLTNLLLEHIQDARDVERQMVEALSQIATPNSVEARSQTIRRILRATEQHVARLDWICREIGPARDEETVGSSSLSQLSSREVEVLRLIAEGYANKQIAAEFGISIKTVEKHRQRMMAKLDLHDTAGVTRFAISVGVVEAVA